MGQVYLESYDGPLYAFIEIKIAGMTITTETAGTAHIGGDLGDVDKYITNVTMSLAVTKTTSDNRGGSSWNIGNEFNLNIFDESACYVEEVVSNAMSNVSMGASCRVEYGWSANGIKIPERSCAFEGLILGYTLSFEGSSTILSIEGTTVGIFNIGTTYNTNDIPNDVTATGKPSEVIKYLCSNGDFLPKGDGITYLLDIEDTEPIYNDENGTEIANLTGNSKSVTEYINNLCTLSKSAKTGATGYTFYMTQDENDSNIVHVHFKASNVDSYLVTYNDKGEVVSEIVYDAEKGAERVYSYYGDSQKSEVLSYSTDFKAYAINSAVSSVSAIDGFTNEIIGVETGDVTIGTVTTAADACRLMGLSSGTYNSLSQCMSDLWTRYAELPYTATLEIMGDPNVYVMEQIQLDVYTKFQQKHHTSGIYLVTSVDDSIDTSGFTTTLSLRKLQKLQSRAIAQASETDKYKNPENAKGFPTTVGGTTDNVINNNDGTTKGSPIVNPPENSRGFPVSANIPTKTLSNNASTQPTTASVASVEKLNSMSTNVVNSNSIVYKDNIKGSSDVANPVIYRK